MAPETFQQSVERLRSEYIALRKSSNFFGKFAYDEAVESVDGHDVVSLWYELNNDSDTDEPQLGQFVRLHDIPGTLSGDVLRLLRSLPEIDGHYELRGDAVSTILEPPPDPVRAPDFEDLGDLLALLPEVEVDPSLHFTKTGKYRSEIKNHITCQGGSIPGIPASRHLSQLLGKSSAGQLVFEKLLPRPLVLGRVWSAAVYKAWILQLLTALEHLHSLEIVHRDLHIENLLFRPCPEGYELVLGDLESRWGQRRAPEILRADRLDSGWTKKSDIYDLGTIITHIIYGNIPATSQVHWPVPPPFDKIVSACQQPEPAARPSLGELRAMVEDVAE